MASIGWVALHRKLQEHWLWNDKPFSKGQAWIDLLLLANHEDKKIVLGNELIEVKQGSFISSELKLMERWGWGKTKTRAFLDLLQNDQMIVKKTDHKKTTITIVNYKEYAVLETTEKPQPNREQTASRPRADTNNNNNNINNNIKKEKYKKKEEQKTSYDEILSCVEDDDLRELYLEFIKMRKMIKAPMTNRALTMLIAKVTKLEPTDIDRQKRILETSILNNWKSVYPLKEDEAAKKQGSMQGTYDIDLFEKMISEK